MGFFSWPAICLTLCLTVLMASQLIQGNVGYDHKAIVINGQRRILFSGAIHYPRSTPEMWEDLIQKAKEGGVDVIETYVFWNVHEPSPGNYNFEGRYDLVRFIKTVQRAGLLAFIRLGPYVCAEWNFGGFPVWLKYVPGIKFRTDNEPFKIAMQRFVNKIVELMKSEELFESQGGPIILSQIENEYGHLEQLNGRAGFDYMTWAAEMAVAQRTGVPWVMCKQDDAPDPMINTCNGFYCNAFTPNKPYKPTMWTEAWTGRYSKFGVPIAQRPVQDLAFAVAQFIQKGGSFVNYYMYHGGTNFGRTAGGPFITTSYDYDAPIDEYGLVRQPKYGHLKELHKSIKMCEEALVSADPIVTSLGIYQQAHVYSSEGGTCAAFLSNYDAKSAARVVFNNKRYNLPPWSISILPDCRNEVFNTAKVGVQTSQMEMLPINVDMLSWESFHEDIYSPDGSSAFLASGLKDQISVTGDASDYLWCATSVDISSSERSLLRGELPTLIVQSAGDALHVFVNGQHVGSAIGTRENMRVKFEEKVNLNAGTNRIALLSVTFGLPNKGGHLESLYAGVLGPVTLQGLSQGTLDLSWQKWTYQVGLTGEAMNLASPNGVSSANWMQASLVVQQQRQPLTWYKAFFDKPEGDEPLALDLASMVKGQVWVNGWNIGRYWLAQATGDCKKCSYQGQFQPEKCLTDCGQPTQRWYHIPRSWLKPAQNLLVILEEVGGDPMKVSLVKRSVRNVCANVAEHQPTTKNWHTENYSKAEAFHEPKVHLQCDRSQAISSIRFASFGTPRGTCGSFEQGYCHSPVSTAVLEKNCIGRRSCSVFLSKDNFQVDPCSSVLKRLAVEAACGPE